jgi:endoglycosylceramidase
MPPTLVALAQLLVLLALLPLSAAHAALSPISLRLKPTGERAFVDSYGRERYFHGTNAIAKGFPWVPTTDRYSGDLSLAEQDLALLQRRGINMLRLGAMWPGVEPARGWYNESYLAELRKITDMAAKHGIYTLLDMHQDDLSEKFCGEGIPAWAVVQPRTRTFPVPLALPFTEYYQDPNANGAEFPTRQECAKRNWPDYYGAGDTAFAFDALYTNKNGVGDSWAAFWAKVAVHFKGDPSILGLELINGELINAELIMQLATSSVVTAQ